MGASAPNALHDSSAPLRPPNMHPNTRLAVLECIMEWIFGSDNREAPHSMALRPRRCGKVGDLTVHSRECVALDILLASFFFFSIRQHAKSSGSLVATIAYQIATRIPQVTSALDSAISRDPMIFKKSLDTQVQQLIVNLLCETLHSQDSSKIGKRLLVSFSSMAWTNAMAMTSVELFYSLSRKLYVKRTSRSFS